jgi:hypothetical protein
MLWGICKEIAIRSFFNQVISRLLALLKFIDSSMQVDNNLFLTVRCKLINFVFQIFLFFIPEISADFTSLIVRIIPIYLTWIL